MMQDDIGKLQWKGSSPESGVSHPQTMNYEKFSYTCMSMFWNLTLF